MTVQKVWRLAVAAFVVVMLVRAIVDKEDRAEDTAPGVPDPAQTILLKGDGVELPFAIERLNVYLVEDEQYPESFEFEGDGIRLLGKIPVSLHVGYDDDWNVLVGKPITFSRRGDHTDSQSEIHIPGEAPYPVTGGAFTIQAVGDGADAKTPLSGELWLRCATPTGERVFRGTFEVKGTTWG